MSQISCLFFMLIFNMAVNAQSESQSSASSNQLRNMEGSKSFLSRGYLEIYDSCSLDGCQFSFDLNQVICFDENNNRKVYRQRSGFKTLLKKFGDGLKHSENQINIIRGSAPDDIKVEIKDSFLGSGKDTIEFNANEVNVWDTPSGIPIIEIYTEECSLKSCKFSNRHTISCGYGITYHLHDSVGQIIGKFTRNRPALDSVEGQEEEERPGPDNTVDLLRENGKIDLTFVPTFHIPLVHAYFEICDNQYGLNLDLPLTGQLQNMCQIVVNSDLCKDVQKEHLLQCESLRTDPLVDFWEYVKGCSSGYFNSASNLLEFAGAILKWAWRNTTAREAREETMEFTDEVMLYLEIEFEKAYANTYPPHRRMKALMQMGGAISKILFDKIRDIIQLKFKQFSCLNYEKKSQIMCKAIGDILIPPKSALALIKHGPKAIAMFKNLRKAFREVENLGSSLIGPAKISRVASEAVRLSKTKPPSVKLTKIDADGVSDKIKETMYVLERNGGKGEFVKIDHLNSKGIESKYDIKFQDKELIQITKPPKWGKY
ncbi:MAG: hypothetical protein OXB84_05965, partial [Halobacteriovoraceae bacterium]|nr:hypothetical protein [Halobacteriovoraceae bacterium]